VYQLKRGDKMTIKDDEINIEIIDEYFKSTQKQQSLQILFLRKDILKLMQRARAAEREQREQLEKQVAEIILDLVDQYAPSEEARTTHRSNGKARTIYGYYSGGLSVLEDAFIWLIAYGYADGDASHIKLTDKALAFWRANENKRKR